jgi:hypothetical protein
MKYTPATRRQPSAEIWEQLRAAWSYICQEENAAKYDEVAVETIKDRIRWAASKRGFELAE